MKKKKSNNTSKSKLQKHWDKLEELGAVSNTGMSNSNINPKKAFGKTESLNPKEIFGKAKPSIYVLPPTAIRQAAAAMENGAKKYGPYNWRKSDKLKATIYLDAMFRHLLEYAERKDVDKDSGLHPLAHLMANCAIVLDAIENDQLDDDRPIGRLEDDRPVNKKDRVMIGASQIGKAFSTSVQPLMELAQLEKQNNKEAQRNRIEKFVNVVLKEQTREVNKSVKSASAKKERTEKEVTNYTQFPNFLCAMSRSPAVNKWLDQQEVAYKTDFKCQGKCIACAYPLDTQAHKLCCEKNYGNLDGEGG